MSTPQPHDPHQDPHHGMEPGPNRQHEQQQNYGHPYGQAPTGGTSPLGRIYTFVLIWLTTALIMWFGTRMFGFERGDIGAAVISLGVSLAAAIGITAWLRRRDG